MLALAAVCAAAVAVPGCGVAAPPAADVALPDAPAAVATAIAADLSALRGFAARWDGHGRPPRELTLYALHEQRLEYRLVDRPSLRGRALAQLHGEDRRAVRDGVRAELDLAILSRGWPLKRRFRTAEPAAAADLWRFYRAGRRRFGVSPTLLAAVNLVES